MVGTLIPDLNAAFYTGFAINSGILQEARWNTSM